MRLLLLPALIAALQGCVPLAPVGLGTGYVTTRDQRRSDMQVEDAAIQEQAKQLIARQYPSGVHVNVASFNQSVLVSGEVPSAAARTEIGSIVAAQRNVRLVHNELAIAAPSTASSRNTDGLITYNVDLALKRNRKVDPAHILSVTEDGTVYLLGTVKRAEAAAAADAASTVKDVRFVIMLFEYLN
jgi:osmotically-inducible protein OsmY